MSCGTGEETVKVERVMYALCQNIRTSSGLVRLLHMYRFDSDTLRYGQTLTAALRHTLQAVSLPQTCFLSFVKP